MIVFSISSAIKLRKHNLFSFTPRKVLRFLGRGRLNFLLFFIFFSNSSSWAFNASVYTVKPLNSGHLRVLKNLSVIKRCPLLEGSLTKTVTIGTKHFVRYSRHVRYLGCPQWRDFAKTTSTLWTSSLQGLLDTAGKNVFTLIFRKHSFFGLQCKDSIKVTFLFQWWYFFLFLRS